jgi:hypothetical protein
MSEAVQDPQTPAHTPAALEESVEVPLSSDLYQRIQEAALESGCAGAVEFIRQAIEERLRELDRADNEACDEAHGAFARGETISWPQVKENLGL